MVLHELHSGLNSQGEAPQVDIVAIHGLNPRGAEGHAFKTWTKSTASNESRLWLRDDLPSDVPRARILLYEYNSFPALAESKTRFTWQANNLLDCLEAERDNDPNRPLIFIAHSLGGILVKQALVLAYNNEHHKAIHRAASGILFFGTPHAGGNNGLVRIGQSAASIIDFLSWSPSNDTMEAVRNGSIYADTLQEHWRHRQADQPIVSFYEKIGNIVSRESATLGLTGTMENIVGLHADHSNMCRFDLNVSQDLANYKLVRTNIKRICRLAERRQELVLPNAPTTIPEPIFQSSQSGPSRNYVKSSSSASQSHRSPNHPFDSFSSNDIRMGIPHTPSLPRNPRGQLTLPAMFAIPSYVASFYLYDYADHRREYFQRRYFGTCDWFMSSNNLKRWQASSISNVLWFSGAPGLGKSTLMAHLTHSLEDLSENRSKNLVSRTKKSSAIAYSFCHEQRNNTSSSVLSSIIHQLLLMFLPIQEIVFKFDISSQFAHKAPLHIPSGKDRSPPILWALLCEIIKEAGLKELFLIVDGLDECEAQSQYELIRLFHSFISESTNPTCLKVIFSSRPYEHITKQFSIWSDMLHDRFFRLKAEDHDEDIKGAIKYYIQGRVADIAARKRRSPGEMAKVSEAMEIENSGLFLPVALLFREIEEDENKSVVEILEHIPNDLAQLYKDLIRRIPEDVLSRQPQLLKYVVYPFEPLTLRDLAYACAGWEEGFDSKPFPEVYMSREYRVRFERDLEQFGPLFKSREEKRGLSIIHGSAKEYLVALALSDPGNGLIPVPGTAHLDISIQCIKLLIAKSRMQFPDHTDFPTSIAISKRSLQSQPCLIFAMRNWHKHLKRASDELFSRQIAINADPNASAEMPLMTILPLMSKFIKVWRSATSGFRWTLIDVGNITSLQHKAKQNPSEIELLSALGLTFFLHKLLEETGSTVPPAMVRSSVIEAIRGGHESTVDLLIQHFDIASLEEDEYRTIIADSAWSRHPGLLPKIMALRPPRMRELVEALTAAYMTGKHETLGLLIENGTIFRKTTRLKRTALHEWIIAHHKNATIGPRLAQAIILYLISNGVEINAQDMFGFTALHYICWSSYLCTKELVLTLVDHGADLFAKTNGGLSPLHFAVRFGDWPEGIELMIEKSNNRTAIVQFQSRGLNTPLHWAAYRRLRYDEDMQILEFLFRAGCDPFATNQNGLTPMRWAGRNSENFNLAVNELRHAVTAEQYSIARRRITYGTRNTTLFDRSRADASRPLFLIPKNSHIPQDRIQELGDDEELESEKDTFITAPSRNAYTWSTISGADDGSQPQGKVIEQRPMNRSFFHRTKMWIKSYTNQSWRAK